MVRAIVGANWGDEGKGKITDMLASESDIVVRFQGGANAGHTIINDYGRFALHLLPSGVCTPGVVNVLGPGVALDIEFFLKELAAIEQQGLPAPKILISERAQVQAMLKDEPGMRNSNLWPVNAKGDVRLRSELSCGICGRLVTPISMLLCPAAL